MNLEDLILETQITELKRLQTRCVEARDQIQKVRNELGELEVQSSETAVRVQEALELEKRRQIERLAEEVRNRLDQAEVDVAGQRESASETRERCLEELHARLKQEVNECRQKLQNELWVLQSVCDETNEDTPVRQAERAQEIFGNQQTFLDQQLSDLDSRVASSALYLQSCHAGMDATLPPVNVEIKGREASRVIAVEQVDLALAAAGRLDRLNLPQWIQGWRLYGLGLLIFVVVAIGATAARADLSRFINPELAKPDWEWFGVSCLIGFGVAVLLGTVLLMIAQSRLRSKFEEVLQHTANSKTASELWKQKSRQELKKLTESAEAWKTAMTKRREQHAAKLQSATDDKVNELIQQYTLQVAKQSRLFDDQILAGESETSHHQTAVENWRSQELVRIEQYFLAEQQKAEAQFAQQTAERRAQLQSEEASQTNRWRSNLMVASELARISQERAAGILPWSEMIAQGWTAPTSLLAALPVGELTCEFPRLPEQNAADSAESAATVSIQLPGLLNFPKDTSILVEHDPAGREAALDFVRAILLKLLTNIAPGRVQFTLIDPVGLGQSFSGLMHLADFDELLINNRIWTESIQIRDRLQKVTEHMESVFQTYLRSEFETIEDYNAAAGEVAEPYHFVVVAGFPGNFTEEAARSLTSILTSGPRCGVHAIVTWSPAQPVPRSFDVSNLRNCCTQFHVAKGSVQPGAAPASRPAEKKLSQLPGEDFLSPEKVSTPEATSELSLQFTALAPPDSAGFVSLVRAVGEQSRNARRVEVSFSRIAPKPEAFWTHSSADGIDFPIGRAGAARLQFMRLGRGTSQHVLVAGKTGSGKSTLLHILITNLSLYYSPDEVQFYLIDFKKGVEFRTYAANKLPHARVVAIESDREFGLSVLERLDEVLQERGELFRVRGVQDVPSFRKQFPNEKMPRLLLLIDEFQEFFTSEDRVSSKAALLMDRLIRQGRAFGIHVLLGSQTLGGAYSLARSTLGQVAVRIALQCSESDAHLILSEENSAARLLTRPGEAIYNDANGMVEGNHPFQIAWLDEAKRESMIHEMVQRPDYHQSASGRMVVFEGNVAPTVDECEPLNSWIAGKTMNRSSEADGVTAWIGDPVAIAAPMSISFLRSGGQNALIVGQEGDQADSILSATVLSLCAGKGAFAKKHRTRVVVLHDGRDESSMASFSGTFTSEITPGFTLYDSSAADAVVAELWKELSDREAGDAGKDRASIILAIRNIGQFRSLRRDEDDFGLGSFGASKPVSPASQLGDLIKKGPLVGIHVIVWSDTFGNAMRWLSNSLLREFDSRVAFRLNQTDSSSLIDNPSAASLSPGRAILYRDQTGDAERFRPFSWPSAEWIAALPKASVADVGVAGDDSPLTNVAENSNNQGIDIPVSAEERVESPPLLPEVPVLESPAPELPATDLPVSGPQNPDAISAVEQSEVPAPYVVAADPVPLDVEVSPKAETPQVAESVNVADVLPVAEIPEVAAVPEVPVGDPAAEKEALAAAEKAAAEKAAAEKAAAEKAAAEKAAAEKAAAEKAAAEKAAAEKAAAEKAAAEKAAAEKKASEKAAATKKAAAEKLAAEKAAADKAAALKKAAAEKAAAEKAAADKAAAEKKAAAAKAIADKQAADKAAAAQKAAAQKASAQQAAAQKTPPKAPVPAAPAPVPADDADGFELASDVPVSRPASTATPPAKPTAVPVTPPVPADDMPDFELSDGGPPKPVPLAPARPGSTTPVSPAPVAETTAAPVRKPSAMAVRLSSRNSDPRRLLDAPPEPKTNEVKNPGLAPGQTEPDTDFDEMDFNSLMIE